jgi:hypothetical protein
VLRTEEFGEPLGSLLSTQVASGLSQPGWNFGTDRPTLSADRHIISSKPAAAATLEKAESTRVKPLPVGLACG